MPGFRLVTNLTPQQAIDTAGQVARRLGFTVEKDGSDLTARKGNMVAGVLLGALFPYCDFRIFVDRVIHDQLTLTIQRNQPSLFLTGQIGVSTVQRRAEELSDAVEDAIVNNGGKVFNRESF